MITNLDKLVEQLREYNQNKDNILENLENLTEEQFEDILVEVAEEHGLTIEETQELVRELFGIGYGIKTAATKVTTPFRKAAGFVKGVGQRIGRAVKTVVNTSQRMDARAKAKYDATKADQREKVEKARMKGAGEVPFSGRRVVRTEPKHRSGMKGGTTFGKRVATTKAKPNI